MKFSISNIFKKKVKNKSKVNNYEYFGAISDILYYSIRNQNEKIAKTISDFMYGAFKKIRDKNQTKEVIYPSTYYDLVYKTIEEPGYLATKCKQHDNANQHSVFSVHTFHDQPSVIDLGSCLSPGR